MSVTIEEVLDSLSEPQRKAYEKLKRGPCSVGQKVHCFTSNANKYRKVGEEQNILTTVAKQLERKGMIRLWRPDRSGPLHAELIMRSAKRIRVGDRVRVKLTGRTGRVVEINTAINLVGVSIGVDYYRNKREAVFWQVSEDVEVCNDDR